MAIYWLVLEDSQCQSRYWASLLFSHLYCLIWRHHYICHFFALRKHHLQFYCVYLLHLYLISLFCTPYTVYSISFQYVLLDDAINSNFYSNTNSDVKREPSTICTSSGYNVKRSIFRCCNVDQWQTLIQSYQLTIFCCVLRDWAPNMLWCRNIWFILVISMVINDQPVDKRIFHFERSLYRHLVLHIVTISTFDDANYVIEPKAQIMFGNTFHQQASFIRNRMKRLQYTVNKNYNHDRLTKYIPNKHNNIITLRILWDFDDNSLIYISIFVLSTNVRTSY